jgi:hypothetical protein
MPGVGCRVVAVATTPCFAFNQVATLAIDFDLQHIYLLCHHLFQALDPLVGWRFE